MSEQELGRLKPLRQFLADRLLDNARSCKSDERARLRDIQVAEHGEARGDAARCGVRKDGDVGLFHFVEPCERGADFRHLHQANGALHHSRPARTRDDHQRQLPFDAAVNRSSDFLAHHRAHAPADELEFHGADDGGLARKQAFAGHGGVLQPGLLLRLPQAFPIALRIAELQRVR